MSVRVFKIYPRRKTQLLWVCSNQCFNQARACQQVSTVPTKPIWGFRVSHHMMDRRCLACCLISGSWELDLQNSRKQQQKNEPEREATGTFCKTTSPAFHPTGRRKGRSEAQKWCQIKAHSVKAALWIWRCDLFLGWQSEMWGWRWQWATAPVTCPAVLLSWDFSRWGTLYRFSTYDTFSLQWVYGDIAPSSIKEHL